MVQLTYNVNFNVPVKVLSYSTAFPNSLFDPSSLLPSALISSPCSKVLPPPVNFSSYSSPDKRSGANLIERIRNTSVIAGL